MPALTPVVTSLIALVAVISVLVAAGCGSDEATTPRPAGTEGVRLTKEEYVARVRTIQIGAYEKLTPLYSNLVADRLPQDECIRKARVFDSELERALDKVAALKPPAEVAGLQDLFLAAANRSATRVGEAVEEVERGRLSCGRPLNGRIYGLRSTEQAQRVLEEFDRRGYDFVYE